MTEIWKQIKDYPDYEVSNLGRIKSNKRNKSRILNGSLNPAGYYRVGLKKDGKINFFYKHRLICCTFNNEPLDTISFVCHKNDIKDDNRLDNLYLGDINSNAKDAIRNNRYKTTITNEEVIEMREIYNNGDATIAEISKLYFTNWSNTCNIVKMKSRI